MNCSSITHAQYIELRTLRFWFVAPLVLASVFQSLSAAEVDSEPRHIERSAHFLVHTDLPHHEATELIDRMEVMFDKARAYWRRPAQGQIECYIVDDLKNWPDDTLPTPMAHLVIDRIGGVTFVDQTGNGVRTRKRAFILAAARRGVAEHEVVHAYCGMAFGETGPAWYREGIAQMFAYSQEKGTGLNCPDDLITYFVDEDSRPIDQVVKGAGFTDQLPKSLVTKLNRHQHLAGFVPISDWSEHDVRELSNLKREYAWSWLACHLLHYNPNYQAQFKSLGHFYLAHREEMFDQVFAGSTKDRLSFEFKFTLHHFAPGYRVDLCYWDWDKRVCDLNYGRTARTRILAARGYQAAGVRVARGHRYHARTSGTWKTNSEQEATGVTGDAQGRGRLEGVVFRDYKLSRSFNAGATGGFRAPCSGELYLRCYDDWSQLADNEGSIVVTIGHGLRK